ncbi:hypothetical protein GGI12_000553 [Dipsacomyces acuminosporus]|nr:hypothetical protein GGI12_000553 [Dipsacomyces acuminosporus]
MSEQIQSFGTGSSGVSMLSSTPQDGQSTSKGNAVSVLTPIPTRSPSVWKQRRRRERKTDNNDGWREQVAEWENHIDKHKQVTGESIFQIPYPRQFIVDGVLHQFKVGNRTDSLDLFWDLVFVGAIQKTAQILIANSPSQGSNLMEHESVHYNISGGSVGLFMLMFSILWKIWVHMDHWSQIFGTYDIVHRLLVVWQMCLVLVMGSEVSSVCTDASTLFISCFVAAKLTMVVNYSVYFSYLPLFRGDIGFIIAMNFIAAATWFGSIWVGSSYQWILWVVCAAIQLLEPIILWITIRACTHWGIPWRCHLALDVNHTIKRHGEFIMLTLGEYVLGSFYNGKGDINNRLACTVIGMLIVACLHWIYFHCEESIQSKHALLRSYTSSFLWTFLHRPLAGFLTVGCFSLSHIAALTEEEQIPDGLAWLFTIGIGGAIVTLSVLGLTHKSLDEYQYTHVSKPVRICLRAMVGVVIIMIAFSNSRLEKNILLPAIVMSICFGLIIFEMVGRVVIRKPDIAGSTKQILELNAVNIELAESRRSELNDSAYSRNVHQERMMFDTIAAPLLTRRHTSSAVSANRGNNHITRSRTIREFRLEDIPGSVPMS